ncbi:glycoside hydrolase family 25 protein [uncultured Methanobrevibacter sp.]|uniref:glycoside hydrolase family 25 protein n=1 Tax=uncultured Methanobrevibacter sp. TaxID=253161 RepID=UPI00262B95AC|nr:glycoside hydrolase family 25 protein [uncultured Methanobrevibacter sp.]
MIKGVDVSAWQGNINWSAVKAAGIGFAIIKCAGSDDGFYVDSRYESNYKGAKDAGIPVGAYYFVGKGCISAADGKADAERFLKLLKGKQFEYPVYMDCEVTSPADKKGATDAAIAFCETLEKAGYYAGIYGSTYSTFESRLDDSRLTRFAHWVAQYANSCTYIGEVGIWQYSSTGYVAGIGGNVDMNYAYVDYPSIIKKLGKNGFQKASSSQNKTNRTRFDAINKILGEATVKRLQEFLNKNNNAGLKVDGDFYKLTYKALQAYLNKEMR